MKWFAGVFNVGNISPSLSRYFKVYTCKTSFFIISRMNGKAAMPSLTGKLFTSKLFSAHCFGQHFAPESTFNWFFLKLCRLNTFKNWFSVKFHRETSQSEYLQPTWFQRKKNLVTSNEFGAWPSPRAQIVPFYNFGNSSWATRSFYMRQRSFFSNWAIQ